MKPLNEIIKENEEKKAQDIIDLFFSRGAVVSSKDYQVVKSHFHQSQLNIVKGILDYIKYKHVIAKTAYAGDSWDSGVHDVLFGIEKDLVSTLQELDKIV